MLKPKLHWIQQIEPYGIAVAQCPIGFKALAISVQSWQQAEVTLVISLLEEHESARFGVAKEAELCEKEGLRFFSYPIEDFNTPDSMDDFNIFVNRILQFILKGDKVLIHCYAGVGRTGILAACLIATLKKIPTHEIFVLLRESRGYEMPATRAQKEWVEKFIETSRGAL